MIKRPPRDWPRWGDGPSGQISEDHREIYPLPRWSLNIPICIRQFPAYQENTGYYVIYIKFISGDIRIYSFSLEVDIQ
jgi:hypothetical protein